MIMTWKLYSVHFNYNSRVPTENTVTWGCKTCLMLSPPETSTDYS